MAQSIRISDELYSLAQSTGQALGRPIAQQMEYWAKLGAALDAAGITSRMAMELLGNGASAQLLVDSALGRTDNAGASARILREKQSIDARQVAEGKRSSRSLFAFEQADLERMRFTPSRTSEYEQAGTGW